MKKIYLPFLIVLLTLTLSACARTSTYRVGASPTPHAEILREAKKHIDPAFDFEIVEFYDYVLPNTALHEGDLIANFFQHIPYLEAQIADHGYDFVNIGGVHIEPIGLYTLEHASLDALPDTLEIIVSNSPADRPRLLGVLETAGLITIKADTTAEAITASAIRNLPALFDSEHSVTFKEVDPTQLYANYANRSGDLVLINGNFALDHGLNPLEDALAVESTVSPYVNVLVTNSDDADNAFIEALYAVLKSEAIAEWIETEFGGSVILAD